jgi:hypothetical protein
MVLTTTPKHRLSIHDKKRQGLHHKSSKHYAKAYWPYLPMLVVVVAGFILNTTWHAGKGVLGYATSVSVSSLLQETNIQRGQNGRAALSLNNQLNQAAQVKANDMATRNYWSHTTPDGKQPWQFISSAGYTYVTAGENLAYGFDSSSAAVAGWMNSPEHRANILDTSFQDVGFGFANSPNYQDTGEETIIVAMYAKPQVAAAPVARSRPATTPAPKPVTQATPVPAASQPVETPAPVATPAANQQQSQTSHNTNPTPAPQAPPTMSLPARPVSRIDVLTAGNAQWAGLALSVLATIGFLTFLLRHARLWRRYLVKGEAFIIRHPLLDTVFLAVGVLGIVLTRTSGFIH